MNLIQQMVGAALAVACVQTATGDNMDTAEILEKVKSTYTTCSTYADTGLVKTTFHQEDGTRISEKPFSTAFVRNGGFRFEYSGKHPIHFSKSNRYIIWSDGAEVRSWWDIRPGIENPESLGMALAGATGVSGGSAHTIPALLMPDEVGGSTPTHLAEAQLLEEGEQNGMPVYRIEGIARQGKGDKTVLWIAQDTFLILRIDSGHVFDDFRTETTTTYHPQLNGTIAPTDLSFNPPGK